MLFELGDFSIDIPLDGVAVTLLAYFMSDKDVALRNAGIIAVTHYILHNRELEEHCGEEEQDVTDYSAPSKPCDC